MGFFDHYNDAGELPNCPNCGQDEFWKDKTRMGWITDPNDSSGRESISFPVDYAVCGGCGYEVRL